MDLCNIFYSESRISITKLCSVSYRPKNSLKSLLVNLRLLTIAANALLSSQSVEQKRAAFLREFNTLRRKSSVRSKETFIANKSTGYQGYWAFLSKASAF